MMKLRATMDNKPVYYDREVLQIANEQDGRMRLTGPEREAYIGFATAMNLLDRTVPVLEKVGKETASLKRMRHARTLMRNTLIKLNGKINLDQLITMSNNVKDVTVTLSVSKEPGYCNVRWDHMQAICNYALEACSIGCAKNREQSKSCPVRKALDCIPGMREIVKERGKVDECPFAGIELDWEDLAL